MRFLNGVKKVSKSLINVPKWMSLDFLRDQTNKLTSSVTETFTIQQPHYSETFEEALQRLHLSEKQLDARKAEFRSLYRIFFVLFMAVFIYAVWHAFLWQIKAMFISLGISAFLLGKFFHYHFWFYQLEKRRLGCTFKEWLKYFVKRTN